MQFQALENSALMETYDFLKLGKYCVSLQSNTQVAKPRHLYLSLSSYFTYLHQWISNLIKTIEESNTISHYELSRSRLSNSIWMETYTFLQLENIV